MTSKAWHLHLTESDVVAGPDGTHSPVPRLVDAVVAAIDRVTSPGYGFALISDVEVLPSPELDSFQINLLESVWAELARRNPRLPPRRALRLNAFQARDGQLTELTGRPFTIRHLHFDPHSLLFAHRYGGPAPQASTAVTLVDVASYMRDRVVQLDEVFAVSTDPYDSGRLLSRRGHREQMLRDHGNRICFKADGTSHLLFIRNDPIEGVAHEIDVPRAELGSPNYSRSFLRTSLARPHESHVAGDPSPHAEGVAGSGAAQ